MNPSENIALLFKTQISSWVMLGVRSGDPAHRPLLLSGNHTTERENMSHEPETATTPIHTGYAPVNGLQMYYEIHGTGQPLVLLHGAFSAIGTSFGALLPGLARTRQVIGVELQGHGRTADIDRPLSLEQMADDVAALLQHLGIPQADIFGYSMGGERRPAPRHPAPGGGAQTGACLGHLYAERRPPGLMEGLGEMKPEMMHGSPWHEEYLRIAPDPDDFATLFAKKTEMDRNITGHPGRGNQGDHRAHPADHRRFRSRPPRARGRDVSPARRRRVWRYAARSAEFATGDPSRHLARDDRITRRTAAPDDPAFLDAPMPEATAG